MIRKIIGFGIGRAIFALVFIAGELFLAPKYFQRLFLLFLNWDGVAQGTYVLPSSAPGMNALFLAWAFALLAVMTAISNVRAEKHR